MSPMPFPHRWSLALASDNRLTATDIATGRALALHMDPRGGSCFPSHERVAFDAGLAIETVRKGIRHLRRFGWLTALNRSAPGRAVAYQAVIPTVPTNHVRTFEHRSPETAIADERRSGETAIPSKHRSVQTRTPVPGDRPGIHEVSISLSHAIAQACGLEPSTLTASERGKLRRAARELAEVGATADEVRRRAPIIENGFRDGVLTPSSLARNWGRAEAARRVQPEVRAADDAAYRRWQENFDGRSFEQWRRAEVPA